MEDEEAELARAESIAGQADVARLGCRQAPGARKGAGRHLASLARALATAALW